MIDGEGHVVNGATVAGIASGQPVDIQRELVGMMLRGGGHSIPVSIWAERAAQPAKSHTARDHPCHFAC
ncbi:hypothetical protein HC928_17390 [bacterium]|nr:hypothetical protein [bacterium]